MKVSRLKIVPRPAVHRDGIRCRVPSHISREAEFKHGAFRIEYRPDAAEDRKISNDECRDVSQGKVLNHFEKKVGSQYVEE
jgi:hypothetical protein